MNVARQAFIESEASSKIKKALRHQTRESTSKNFMLGDAVYYKRNNSKEWHGPGTIDGIDGKVVLVRHGGVHVRVHPVSLRKVNDDIENNDEHCINILTNIDDNVLQKTTQLQEHPVISETIDATDETGALSPEMVESLEGEQVNENISSNSATQEQNTVVRIPKVKDRIKFTDPDTLELNDYIVVSRAGKATGVNKYWMNVKNCVTGERKAVDFRRVRDWTHATEEVWYTSEDYTMIEEAKQSELRKWQQYHVYEEVYDDGQETITTRWVITEDNNNEDTPLKARLVARGFEEDSTDIKTDSPTICKENLPLVSTLGLVNGWKIHSIDIKSAFLQGFPIDRTVYLLPPPEAATNKLWKLNTAIYGLCDASRTWYLKVYDELVKAGANRSIYDNALFYYQRNGRLEGIFCSHVDDFFFVGSKHFHETIIQRLRDQFNLSKEHNKAFKFLGITMRETTEGITMNQKQYINSMNVSNVLKKLDQKVNRDEARQLKGLVGQLQRVAKQTRPDIAFLTCQLSTRVRMATYNDIRSANKQLLKLKQNVDSQVIISHVGDLSQSNFLVFSDASHANLPNGGSQGGFMIFIHGSNNRLSPLLWSSRRLKRVVKSSMAAETMILLESIEHTLLLNELLFEVTGVRLQIICTIDSKSLYDALLSTKVVEDKLLHIDISALRQMISEGKFTVRLTTTSKQLANCLTKASASSEYLMRVIGGEEVVLTS